MAIECVHVYSNGGRLDLPLTDYSSSQLAVTNIEGLDPVPASINLTPYASKDGSIFNSSRRQERNIVITMKMFGNPSMEETRNKVYVMCPVEGYISLVFDYSDKYSKKISGYVESVKSDYFGEFEGIQVSVICPDPNLYRVSYVGLNPSVDPYRLLNYKMITYPAKQIIKSRGTDLEVEWVDPCRDESETYLIDSLLKVINKTNRDQEYLFAISFVNDRINNFYVNFYKKNFDSEIYDKEINSYIDASSGDEFEYGMYFYIEDGKYKEIENETEFNYMINKFLNLEEPTEFISLTYYSKKDTYETDKWIKVSWDADYIDQESSEYVYPVRYGFLNVSSNIIDTVGVGFKYILKTEFDIYIPNFYYVSNGAVPPTYTIISSIDPPQDFYTDKYKYYRKTPINGNEVYSNNISLFETEASYFTHASSMFYDLSKKGTQLSSYQEFVSGNFYKLLETLSPLLITNNQLLTVSLSGGWRLVSNDEELYFLDNLDPYKYSNGYFNSDMPLYAINRIAKKYIPKGETFNPTLYYYYIDSEGNEIQIHGTKPADFGLISSKYYLKTNIYDAMVNYPENTSLQFDNRPAYDVILDYFGYTYDEIDSEAIYEPNKYYKYVGTVSEELESIYGLSEIPIYHLLTEDMPSDWGRISNTYFTRRRRTFEENIYPIYINDHAYKNIVDRNVYKYEALIEIPEDWDEGYSNYYTLENDFSNIVAYFAKPKYIDYSDLFTVLEDKPTDWDSHYSSYYLKTIVYSGILKKNGIYISKILPNESDANLLSQFDLKDPSDFGDLDGTNIHYELKMPYDSYYPGKYYSYDSENNTYTLIESTNEPEDFYTELYKYYKKVQSRVVHIPYNVVIFWNPYRKELEYDMDQYDMFLNDFEQWYSNVTSTILKIYESSSGKMKFVRSNNFITYSLPSSIINYNYPYLNIDSNCILVKAIKNSNLSYNEGRVIAIASIIE